jgi:hypothetical protein
VGDGVQGAEKITGENDVAIGVAEDFVAGDFLDAAEDGAQALRTILLAVDRRRE